MTDLVLSETRDRVAILTLNRPDKLNALNYALMDRLLSRLDLIETDDGVRAVILTGAGERAFSAGGDIHEFSLSVAEGTDVALRDFVMRGQRLTARLEAFRKPVIAAVNGLAFSGGCEITEAGRWPSPATAPCSPSRKSSLPCRRLSAARSGCRGLPAASARWSCC